MDSMHAFETQRRTIHREEPANVSRSDASVRSESANLRIVRMLISRWCWACRRRLCQRSWDTPRIGQLIQTGRHPQLHFRGLLRLYSRYGLQGCSPAQRRTFVPRLRPASYPTVPLVSYHVLPTTTVGWVLLSLVIPTNETFYTAAHK